MSWIQPDRDIETYHITRKLIGKYEKLKLEVNGDKLECMCTEGEQQDLEIEKRIQIRQCKKYKYLRGKISHDGTLDKGIYERKV